MKHYDALIAGYGPVGSTLANLLGRQGLSVLILEPTLEVYDKPRAIGMDHEAMRVMQACGVARELAPHVKPFPGGKWLGADGETISELDPYPPPFPLGWTPNVTFIQPQLEKMLRAQVDRRPTVDVRLGWKLVDFEQDDDGVTVHARDTVSDATERFRTDYLFACDGASSPVRNQLSVAMEDQQFDEWWVVIDAFLSRPTPLPDRSVQFCNPARPTTFIRGPREMLRWELKVMPGERPEDFKDHVRILDALRPYADPGAVDIWRSAVYRFHALIADGWRRGRVLLVGDAAHQTPPFLGQGLCSGIRDAANLAWKLSLVHDGQASQALLDTYEQERRPHVTTVVERAKEFGLLIGELDPQRAAARDERMRREMAQGQRPRLRQGYIPDLVGGVLDPRKSPATGGLFVQPRVRDGSGAEHLLDDCAGDGFWLVTRDRQTQNWLDLDMRAAWSRIGATRLVLLGQDDAHQQDVAQPSGTAPEGLLVVQETGQLFADMADKHHFAAVIVRPDRYVYGSAAAADDLRRLVRSLLSQLSPNAHDPGTNLPHRAIEQGSTTLTTATSDRDDYRSIGTDLSTTEFRQPG